MFSNSNEQYLSEGTAYGQLGEIDENVLNENSQTNLANSNDEDDSLGAVAVASFSYIKDEVQRHDELNFTYDVLYSKEYGDEGLETFIDDICCIRACGCVDAERMLKCIH